MDTECIMAIRILGGVTGSGNVKERLTVPTGSDSQNGDLSGLY